MHHQKETWRKQVKYSLQTKETPSGQMEPAKPPKLLMHPWETKITNTKVWYLETLIWVGQVFLEFTTIPHVCCGPVEPNAWVGDRTLKCKTEAKWEQWPHCGTCKGAKQITNRLWFHSSKLLRNGYVQSFKSTYFLIIWDFWELVSFLFREWGASLLAES